jgi:hypothetical protein
VGHGRQRGGEGAGVPVRRRGLAGPGLLLGLGQLVSPRPLFPFLIFFPISFIQFAKMPQINSNHFQKFLKFLELFLK